MANQGAQLQNENDTADAAHEAGDHRIWDQRDVLSHPGKSQQDLKDTAKNHGHQGQTRIACEDCDDSSHHHSHGARGTGNLSGGTSEKRGKKSDEYSPV